MKTKTTILAASAALSAVLFASAAGYSHFLWKPSPEVQWVQDEQTRLTKLEKLIADYKESDAQTQAKAHLMSTFAESWDKICKAHDSKQSLGFDKLGQRSCAVPPLPPPSAVDSKPSAGKK